MATAGNRQTPRHSKKSHVLIDVERSDLEARVLDHFHQNSHAMDSAEGVARFWVNENLRIVERCLLDLHDQGLLQKRTIAGTDFYSLQKDPQRPAAPQTSSCFVPQAEVRGRILIVDDDPSVRKFLMEALAEAGHSVELAEDGERAIVKIRAEAFDLL